MDYVVQKATELGINVIQPVFTEYCTVKLKGSRLNKRTEHWQKVAISAAEQSGRTCPPLINEPIDIAAAVAAASGTRCVLDPEGAAYLRDVIARETPTEFALLTGPEGGLSAAEIDLAAASDFNRVYLGPRILRTETAPLAALAIVQMLAGDLSPAEKT